MRDKEYPSTADRETMVIVQIETKHALEHLDDIFSVDGVDACFIGPMDFTMSLGIPGQLEHPMFEEAMTKILEASRRHGVVPGIVTVPIEGKGCMPDLGRLLERGFRMISLGYDIGFLLDGASSLLKKARALIFG